VKQSSVKETTQLSLSYEFVEGAEDERFDETSISTSARLRAA